MYLQRLRDLREDADLNQTDIAEYLGIQQTVYSRYERGMRTIPLEHLIRLADFYNVSLDYLVGRTNNTKTNRLLHRPIRYAKILLRAKTTGVFL